MYIILTPPVILNNVNGTLNNFKSVVKINNFFKFVGHLCPNTTNIIKDCIIRRYKYIIIYV